jgi:excisionase family DNA binding protein
MTELPNVLTPAMLADRWSCSEQHIRNMIDRGQLPSFKIGDKLLRIRREHVEAFECQNGDLHGSEANSASLGKTSEVNGDVIDLGQRTLKKRPAAPRLDTRNSRARPARM